jgi:predicted CoA-binding protein
MSKEKKKIIIFAGAKSSTWDKESNQLAKILEEEGYNVVAIISINGLKYPKIEYLK